MLNVLVCGPSGCGKKTVIEHVLRDKFGSAFKSAFFFKSYDIHAEAINKKFTHELYFKQNGHIFEFFIKAGTNNDRYIVSDIIKPIANTFYIDSDTSLAVKIIVLYNVENFSREALIVLSTIISSSSTTCRFILVASNVSVIPTKVQNQCTIYRMKRPSLQKTTQLLARILSKENVKLDETFLKNICLKNENNLQSCITDAQFGYLKIDRSIHDHFNEIVSKILNNGVLKQIRNDVYVLMINNISSKQIIKELLIRILDKLGSASSIETIAFITHTACIYEHRTVYEERAMYHVEAFIVHIKYILEKGL